MQLCIMLYQLFEILDFEFYVMTLLIYVYVTFICVQQA